MWQTRVDEIPSGRRYEITRAGDRLSFRACFDLLEHDQAFADWYTRILVDCGFAAFFWEHPPFSIRSIDREAEFVLIEAPSLVRTDPDPAPFEAPFADQPGADVIAFENLGGDALLIVPRPIGKNPKYPHLAGFLRHAPPSHSRALWRRAAIAVRENLGHEPRWLSTAGQGVSWLHLRLDSSPKYYQYAPYRRST